MKLPGKWSIHTDCEEWLCVQRCSTVCIEQELYIETTMWPAFLCINRALYTQCTPYSHKNAKPVAILGTFNHIHVMTSALHDRQPGPAPPCWTCARPFTSGYTHLESWYSHNYAEVPLNSRVWPSSIHLPGPIGHNWQSNSLPLLLDLEAINGLCLARSNQVK